MIAIVIAVLALLVSLASALFIKAQAAEAKRANNQADLLLAVNLEIEHSIFYKLREPSPPDGTPKLSAWHPRTISKYNFETQGMLLESTLKITNYGPGVCRALKVEVIFGEESNWQQKFPPIEPGKDVDSKMELISYGISPTALLKITWRDGKAERHEQTHRVGEDGYFKGIGTK